MSVVLRPRNDRVESFSNTSQRFPQDNRYGHIVPTREFVHLSNDCFTALDEAFNSTSEAVESGRELKSRAWTDLAKSAGLLTVSAVAIAVVIAFAATLTALTGGVAAVVALAVAGGIGLLTGAGTGIKAVGDVSKADRVGVEHERVVTDSRKLAVERALTELHRVEEEDDRSFAPMPRRATREELRQGELRQAPVAGVAPRATRSRPAMY